MLPEKRRQANLGVGAGVVLQCAAAMLFQIKPGDLEDLTGLPVGVQGTVALVLLCSACRSSSGAARPMQRERATGRGSVHGACSG